MKSNLLYLAMFLIVMCMPFRGSGSEIRWIWDGLLWVPLVSLLSALVCIALYLHKGELAKRSADR